MNFLPKNLAYEFNVISEIAPDKWELKRYEDEVKLQRNEKIYKSS